MPRAATSVATSTLRVTGSERVQRPLPLVLVAVTVDGRRVDAGPLQLLGEPVGSVLGPDEEQRPGGAAGHLGGDGELVVRVQHEQAVLGRTADTISGVTACSAGSVR